MAYEECHLKEWQADCLLPPPPPALSITLKYSILYHFAGLDSLLAICLEGILLWLNPIHITCVVWHVRFLNSCLQLEINLSS